jgi:cyclopropane-fatty-acyl-phospholipid synthase
MAQTCGVDVAGVTLSKEQLAVSQRRARQEGLAGQVEFRLQDYRNITERFDRIVSVGMFEHVGLAYYEAFFQKIAGLLHEDGVALIHTIGAPGIPGDTNPFITKYIFPGGYLPSLSEIMPAIERAGLVATDIEVLRLHYAETLRAWRERFMARRAEAARLYDERFCRMWEIYLAGSEACFRLGQLVNFQIQLTRKVDALPMTRDYMVDRERQMRARDKPQVPLRMAGE